MLEILVAKAMAGQPLEMDEVRQAVGAMVAGEVDEVQIAALLTALAIKGETAEEIAGAAAALRDKMTPIRASRHPLVDTCGTGGDGSGTFNISTATAIVTAAAGVAVAKHGNRRITSRTGSADVLAELGVNIEAELPVVERCLEELGLTFCFAPLWHASLKRVAQVRRTLGFPTIFNYIGPLANPASADVQVIGVGRAALRPKIASALQCLKAERAIVVHGADGLDEVALAGPTDVSIIDAGELRELRWTPEDFGLKTTSHAALIVTGPSESAAMIRGILDGKPGPPRDIVIANAAAALWLGEAAPTLSFAAGKAASAIDTGAARLLLSRLAEMSHGKAASA